MWVKNWPEGSLPHPLPNSMPSLKSISWLTIVQLMEDTQLFIQYIPIHHQPLLEHLGLTPPITQLYQGSNRTHKAMKILEDQIAFSDNNHRSQRGQLDKINVRGKVNHTTKKTIFY